MLVKIPVKMGLRKDVITEFMFEFLDVPGISKFYSAGLTRPVISVCVKDIVVYNIPLKLRIHQ